MAEVTSDKQTAGADWNESDPLYMEKPARRVEPQPGTEPYASRYPKQGETKRTMPPMTHTPMRGKK